MKSANKCSCHIEMKADMKEGGEKMLTMKDDGDVHWRGCGTYFTVHTNVKCFIPRRYKIFNC